jgi:TM2 domain-containing membrane protein YozV
MSELTPEEIAYRTMMLEKLKARHPMPALLSAFLPGVGQMMKGSILRGVGVWAALGVSFLLCMAYVGVVLVPLVWLWNIIDAYREPEA